MFPRIIFGDLTLSFTTSNVICFSTETYSTLYDIVNYNYNDLMSQYTEDEMEEEFSNNKCDIKHPAVIGRCVCTMQN